MSVNHCSVGELIKKLQKYDRNLEVCVPRFSEYSVTNKEEVDGISSISLVSVYENFSVYNVDKDHRGIGQEVLVLLSTPLEDFIE